MILLLRPISLLSLLVPVLTQGNTASASNTASTPFVMLTRKVATSTMACCFGSGYKKKAVKLSDDGATLTITSRRSWKAKQKMIDLSGAQITLDSEVKGAKGRRGNRSDETDFTSLLFVCVILPAAEKIF